MIIPLESLPEDTLNNLIAEYVSREGTDYGEVELSNEVKCNNLKAKLISKEYVITFSEEYQTTSIHLCEKFTNSARFQ